MWLFLSCQDVAEFLSKMFRLDVRAHCPMQDNQFLGDQLGINRSIARTIATARSIDLSSPICSSNQGRGISVLIECFKYENEMKNQCYNKLSFIGLLFECEWNVRAYYMIAVTDHSLFNLF